MSFFNLRREAFRKGKVAGSWTCVCRKLSIQFIISSPQRTCEVGVGAPILQMRNLRITGVQSCVQIHIDRSGKTWELDSAIHFRVTFHCSSSPLFWNLKVFKGSNCLESPGNHAVLAHRRTDQLPLIDRSTFMLSVSPICSITYWKRNTEFFYICGFLWFQFISIASLLAIPSFYFNSCSRVLIYIFNF